MVFSDPLLLFAILATALSVSWRARSALSALSFGRCDRRKADWSLCGGMPPGSQTTPNAFYFRPKAAFPFLHGRSSRQMVQVFRGFNEPWPFFVPGRSLVC